MQKNFFTGRSQLYNNNQGMSYGGVNIHIENNITIETHAPKVTVIYNDYCDDELKPLFIKVI